MTDLNAILPELSDPFPLDFLRWEPVRYLDGGQQVLISPYVATAHYEDRLSQLAPGWTKDIQMVKPEMVARCELTVCDVTRIGLGSGDYPENVKIYKSFVQACQSFGLGRYLRYLQAAWVRSEQIHAQDDGTYVVDMKTPSWAHPGGEGYPTKNTETQRTAILVAKAKVPALAFANQPPQTRLLDIDIAGAYELKVYGDLYLKAKLAGVDLSFINVIVAPITVGELRRRYASLNKMYQTHMEQKGE